MPVEPRRHNCAGENSVGKPPWKSPWAYGSPMESERANERAEPEWRSEEDEERAWRRVTACIPRREYASTIARKGMTPKGHCSLAWLALLCSALRSAFRVQFREGRIHARPPSALVVLHSHAPSSSVTAARGSFRRERERTTTTTSELRPARNASFWNVACNRASSCVYFSVPVPRHPSPPPRHRGASHIEHAINPRRRRRIFEINSWLKINSHVKNS